MILNLKMEGKYAFSSALVLINRSVLYFRSNFEWKLTIPEFYVY